MERVGGEDGQALMEIIRQAFEVGRSGNLPIARVMKLLRMNIRAPQWVEAARILSESMTPEKGKVYLAVEARPGRQQDRRPIRLDIASCRPEVAE